MGARGGALRRVLKGRGGRRVAISFIKCCGGTHDEKCGGAAIALENQIYFIGRYPFVRPSSSRVSVGVFHVRVGGRYASMPRAPVAAPA